MTDSDPRSRRDLIAAVGGGALFGALWGAAFPLVATERRPTISVIGHRNAQVLLVDASGSRTLVLSGEPDDDLMEMLPAIMTIFRQRVDLLVAAPDVLADLALDLQGRWRVRHALALSGEAGIVSTGVGTTVVTDALDVSLGERMRLGIRMGHRNAWRVDAPSQPMHRWCATLETSAGNVVIAPDIASIATVGPPPSTLTIVPNAPAADVLAVSPAAALAVNYDSDTIPEGPEASTALTRIYPRDVARFVIADDAILLPEWTATTSTL